VTEARDRQPVSPRRKGWRRVLALVLVIAVVVAGGLFYRHYTNPERIRDFAKAYLQDYVRGPVTIGSASFSWWDGVRLFDVAICEIPRRALQSAPPGVANPQIPVFSCREVRLTYDRASTVSRSLRIESIVALEPTCMIVRDAADGRTNLAGLLRWGGDADHGEPGPLPTIELRDARVQVISREEGRDRMVEDIRLDVRARPSQHDSQVYNVVWHGGHGRIASGHSRIDLQTGRLRNVEGGLPWMSIEAVMLAINARYDGAGAWCDLLGLDGTVSAKDYDLSGSSGVDGSRSAIIELSDASISIPITEKEQPLPPEERYLRFERVNGLVRLTTEGISAEFAGLFHGGKCIVSAMLRGRVERLTTLDDVDFDARLSVTGLTLPRPDPESSPAEVRFINRWRPLVGLYRDYDPHGPIDVEIEAAKKAGANEPIVVRRAMLTARGGDVKCRYFPYYGHNIHGTVEYASDGVFIRDMRGSHGGGTIIVNGRLAKPTASAAKEVTIEASGIPIDDALYEALPERYLVIREQFEPKGTVDARIELVQPTGTLQQPGEWQTHATITLRDGSAACVRFPYPVDHLTGTLVTDGDQLQIVGITGRLGDGRVAVDGTVSFAVGELIGLDLAVDAQDVPFDDTLLSALHASARELVEAFHPCGRFDSQTSLTLDAETKKVAHTSLITLRDVAIRHDDFPVEVTGVGGRLHITPDEIVLESLTGRYNDATILAEGSVSRTGERQATAVMIRSRNLRLDKTLCEALPPKMGDILSDWEIEGPVSTETVISTGPTQAGNGAVVRTVARLDGPNVHHPFFPVPIHDVRAEITIDQTGARATDVEARYGSAGIRVSFDARHGDGTEEGTIKLVATGATLDDSLRGLLPVEITAAWDRVRPGGSIDVHLDSLRYHRSGPERPREWSLAGYVEFNDATIPGLADIERMSGTLTVSGSIIDRLGGTSLSGDLKLSTVNVLGHRLSRTQSSWSYTRVTDGEGMFVLDPIEGRIYDGSLAAHVEVAFDRDRSQYSLSATVHNMQIEPFISADRASQPPDDKKVDVRGLADAHLYLSGVIGDRSSRRGGGQFEIIDGHIYRLPIILAILNVLNLSIPDQDAFDDARADLFIVGNRVRIKDIVLRGSVLGLVGSGSMTLPDLGLDLNLVHVSPHRWVHVPVLADFVEAASREFVELHVTGPLSQPTVRAKPFRRISEEFKRLFRKRKPKRIQPATP